MPYLCLTYALLMRYLCLFLCPTSFPLPLPPPRPRTASTTSSFINLLPLSHLCLTHALTHALPYASPMPYPCLTHALPMPYPCLTHASSFCLFSSHLPLTYPSHHLGRERHPRLRRLLTYYLYLTYALPMPYPCLLSLPFLLSPTSHLSLQSPRLRTASTTSS
jgi:hypothetical protein